MVKIGEMKVYTTQEASEMLGLRYNSLLNYIKSGRIKAKKLGVKYMIPEKALQDYFLS